MKAAYGIDIEAQNDHYVEIAEKGAEGFSGSFAPGSNFVDFIPAREHPIIHFSRLKPKMNVICAYSTVPSRLVSRWCIQKTGKSLEACC